MVLVSLFGGTALLLYGIRLSGEAFQRALGGRLRSLLTGLSRRRFMAVLSGAVDIEIGDGTVRRLGPGDILIAEDLTGQGHVTREVGPEARVSIFVPLR